MTKQIFLALYPQFSVMPENVTDYLITLANARFSYLEEDADHARMLWTAHQLTLHAMTAAGENTTVEQLAEAGQALYVTGKKVGDVSVTVANAGGASASRAAGDLDLTVYGRRLGALIAGGTVYVR